jgi:hypothetical protein
VLNLYLNRHRIEIFIYTTGRFYCQKQPTRCL